MSYLRHRSYVTAAVRRLWGLDKFYRDTGQNNIFNPLYGLLGTPLEKAFNRHFIVQIPIASGNQYYDTLARSSRFSISVQRHRRQPS